MEAGEDQQLTLKQCRDLIGEGASLTDTEVASLRSQAYILADVITAAFLQEKADGVNSLLGSHLEHETGVHEPALPVVVQ